MGIGTKVVTYGAVVVLSFGAGYGANYYMQNKGTNYTIGIGSGNWGIKKHKGIDNTIDNAVDNVKKKAENGQETVEEIIDEGQETVEEIIEEGQEGVGGIIGDIGKKIMPDKIRR